VYFYGPGYYIGLMSNVTTNEDAEMEALVDQILDEEMLCANCAGDLGDQEFLCQGCRDEEAK